jgi:hypothetical protein
MAGREHNGAVGTCSARSSWADKRNWTLWTARSPPRWTAPAGWYSSPSDNADLRAWLPAMSAILPGEAGRPGPDDDGMSAGVPGERSAVVRGEAVLRVLRWLARPGGLLVVLEDLHWADPDTLAVLEYLADNLGTLPVLGVATSRDEPPTEALGLARRLQARQAAAHLALDRLDDRQVTTMVQACLPGAGEDVVARVRDTADGVPFLIEEVLASPGVPTSFRDTVRARLSALGDAERLVLGAAAVLGRHFDWRLLGRVTSQPPDVPPGRQLPAGRGGGGAVEALALAGRIEEAMAAGAAVMARLSADPVAERTRARVHIWLAHAAVAATRWPVAQEQLAQATSLLGAPGNRDLLAEVMVLRAEVAMAAGDPGQARTLADGVLDMPEASA